MQWEITNTLPKLNPGVPVMAEKTCTNNKGNVPSHHTTEEDVQKKVIFIQDTEFCIVLIQQFTAAKEENILDPDNTGTQCSYSLLH